MHTKLEKWLSKMPIIAILRGVQPDQAADIGQAIYRAGIGIIEVPLNSPNPFQSIKNLSDSLGDECVIGCGTLLKKSDITKVVKAGGEIGVTPNTNPRIIKHCIKQGLIPMPGWATPTEAFAAYKAGARYLKLFPAATYGPGHVKAVRAVLPKDVKLLAVGGVGADVASIWLEAGIDGFGIGRELYSPTSTPQMVSQRAQSIVSAILEAKTNTVVC